MSFGSRLMVAGFAVWSAVAVSWSATAQPAEVSLDADLVSLVRNAESGQVIQLGAGTYEIADELIFTNSGVTLQGLADGSSRVVFAEGYTPPAMDSVALIDLNGQSNITLKNIELSGENRTSGATYGVYAFGGSGHRIENLDVVQLNDPGEFGPIGVYFNGGVDQSVVRHSTFTQIGVNSDFGSGIRIHGDADGNLIEHNTIDQTGRGGIFALGNNDGPTLGTSTLDDLVIRHNTVTNSALSGGPDLGIEVQNDIRDAVIENNVIDRRISVDNAQRVAVRDNTITQASNNTVATGAYGVEIVNAQDIVATGNQVLGDVHLGVSISGDGDTRHALFADNLIQNATTFGVQVQGRDNADATGVAEDLYFLNNEITGTLGGPPSLYYPDFITGDGVRFNMAFDDITLDQNTIADNGGEDLFLNDTPVGSTVALSDNITDDTYVEGNGLELITPPLTQQTFIAEVGESITVTFDDLDGTFTHVLWDTGQGAPIAAAHASVTLTAEWLGDSRRVVVVAWDDAGGADTAVVLIPEPGLAVMALSGGLLFTLRPSRRSRPWPSSL
ncbi:MAG: right-handed parallel beta-helix repeat-containing protein [Planctomycetota bacterium]